MGLLWWFNSFHAWLPAHYAVGGLEMVAISWFLLCSVPTVSPLEGWVEVGNYWREFDQRERVIIRGIVFPSFNPPVPLGTKLVVITRYHAVITRSAWVTSRLSVEGP